MNLTEFKKELSALSGVDFFNPKYRNVFKKYCPNATIDNEEERLNEVLGEEEKETNTETNKSVETQEEKTNEELSNAENKAEDTSINEKQNNTEEIENSSEEENEQNSEDESSDSEEPETTDSDISTEPEETSETTEEESSQETENAENETSSTENNSNELLETKIELQLVKSGIREDRIDSAKKLFLQDIKSLEDLDKLKELIQQYPEWLKENKTNAKAFGMSLGDREEVLTEEEKRLEEMGISPRD